VDSDPQEVNLLDAGFPDYLTIRDFGQERIPANKNCTYFIIEESCIPEPLGSIF
jgi:hypothetical protein